MPSEWVLHNGLVPGDSYPRRRGGDRVEIAAAISEGRGLAWPGTSTACLRRSIQFRQPSRAVPGSSVVQIAPVGSGQVLAADGDYSADLPGRWSEPGDGGWPERADDCRGGGRAADRPCCVGHFERDSLAARGRVGISRTYTRPRPVSEVPRIAERLPARRRRL